MARTIEIALHVAEYGRLDDHKTSILLANSQNRFLNDVQSFLGEK